MISLFENLQILRESDEYFWKYSGNVYINDMKSKRCIGEIKDPIYTYTSNDNIGAAYRSFIDHIITGNRLYDYSQQIQIDKNNIEKIDSLPDNSDGNLMATIETITESYGMERYSYIGPVFRFERLYDTIKQPIYTIAKSYEEAIKNICFKLKEKYGLIKGANLTIDKNKVKRNDEIEKSTKNIEKQLFNIGVNDPKYNFDDPDRENNIVESVMSFDDWLDCNFNKLVKDYTDLYEINEEDVYNDNEDFENYINNEYENYYRNTNRYIDDEDDELTEGSEISKTYNYKITFDLDVEDSIDYDENNQTLEIININDDCFNETFDTKDKINEFQNWFNEVESEESKISISDITYDGFDGHCSLKVALNSKLQDEKDFAKDIVMYLFDNESPKVTYHISGTYWKDYWDYATTSPGQKEVPIEYDDSADIRSYSNVNIQQI